MALLACRASASNQPWVEVRTEHFRVISDSGERQARRITDQFERMHWMFKTLFPKANVDPAQPIVVVCAKNRKAFQAMEPSAYLAKGALDLAGYFATSNDKDYVILRTDAEFSHPYATVYHEYTHLQFADDGDWLPLWLNEGLAEFFQNTDIHEKDVALGEPSADDILFLRENRLIPLPVLLGVDHNSPYYHDEQKGSIFYSESWALTHYLFVTGKQRGKDWVTAYMQHVSRHEDPVEAAQAVFGDLNQLQRALESYIRSSDYKQFILSSAAAPIDESRYKVRTLSLMEEDDLRADVLAHVQRNDEAKALATAVLKDHPDDAAACATLGLVALHSGDMDAARAWYSKAVQRNTDDFFAVYEYGSGLQRMSGGSGKESEAPLRTALHLNPRYFPTYISLGWALMASEQYDDATTVLQDGVKVARTKAERREAQKRIEEVKQMRAVRSEQVSTVPTGTVDLAPVSTVVDIAPAPRHPAEPATGPKYQVDGVIQNVECSYPSVIDFVVQGTKRAAVYSNNYFKLDVSSTNVAVPNPFRPCDQLQGMKARVTYAESSDKAVDGAIVSIVLHP